MINNIRNNPDKNPPNLRYIERKKVKVATNKINKVISIITTENITETNTLIKAAANCVVDMVEYKQRETNDKREPHWRRRILEKQKKLRKDLGQISRMKRNELHNARTKEKIERTYYINEKSIEVVHEEVKQRLIAMGAKLERYDNRTKQFRQNRLFESNQKKLFDELEGKERQTAVPDAEESGIFWNDIWGQPVRHNENAEWLITLAKEQVDIGIQENIQINLIKLKKQITRIPNWKSPGPDGVQGYWIKNLSAMHDRISNQLNECLQEESVPIWMVTGKTLLCVKEIEKGNIVYNFRPITCLPLLWKLHTAVLADELYRHLYEKSLLPWEQNGCRKGSRGTKDQLLIDKMIVKKCKRRLASLG